MAMMNPLLGAGPMPPGPEPIDPAGMRQLTPEALMGPNPQLTEEAMRYEMMYPMGGVPIPPELSLLFEEAKRRERGSLLEPDPMDPGISLPMNPLLGNPAEEPPMGAY